MPSRRPTPQFFVSIDSKWFSIPVSLAESTLADIRVSVDCKSLSAGRLNYQVLRADRMDPETPDLELPRRNTKSGRKLPRLVGIPHHYPRNIVTNVSGPFKENFVDRFQSLGQSSLGGRGWA
jgi:hypothetical protein